MKEISKEWLAFLQEQYPAGSRVQLREMAPDEPYPIKPGSMGTLKHIDDNGTFHVNWDDGRGLGLVIGQDRFSILPPQPQTLKLYMPLTADLYEVDEYGDFDEDIVTLDGCLLTEYAEEIREWLEQENLPTESERGLMHYYHQRDEVERKVKKLVFTAEERERQLWGVAECQLWEALTPAELDRLKEYATGQASDGFGEGVEQREILVDGGSELYIHLWNGENWDIQTEEERFGPDQSQVPQEEGPWLG